MPLQSGVTLYVVRHGETEWNRLQRLQGQTDIPLNDTGRAQAAANGRRLAANFPGLAELDFVASPLGRTAETMELLREAAGLPRTGYRTDPRLMEVKYGHWEGAYLEDLKRSDPEGYRQRRDDKFHWRPQDGESYADLMTRADGWLSDVRRDGVVVTHGGITRVLRGLVAGLSEDDIPMLDVPQDRVMVLEPAGFRWL